VSCREPYQPPVAPDQDEVRERLSPLDSPKEDTPGEEDTPGNQAKQAPAPPETEPSNQGPPPVIYRQVEDIPAEDSSSSDADADKDRAEPDELVRLAEEAFAKQHYESVIRHLERLPASAFDTRSMALYGRSLAKRGEHQRAQRWLVGAVAEDASVHNVGALYEVYRTLGATKKLHQLCERYDDDEALDGVLESCPKEQLIEHLQNNQH
jgi:hypothetical protein